MNSRRYIITGGGGSGKTSIINFLNDLGYETLPEVSRQLIIEQQKHNGDLLPWSNLHGFGTECLNRMIQQVKYTNQNITFLDRGTPDILAYFKTKNLKWNREANLHLSKYQKTVFICPPWQQIFINDPQRPESFEQSGMIYQNLKTIYTKLGFTIIEIPKTSISERALFLLKIIDQQNYFKGTSKTLPSVAR